MQITDHIASLLYRYECVVIPGFGAFLTQRQSAKIDPDTQAFYPPSKSISFNRQLKENDGVLVNYISQAEGISYEQSFKKVQYFIENILETIEQNQKVNLKGIGMFYSQADKILFQPDLSVNYLPEAFGFTAFTPEKVNREVAVTVPVEKTPEKPVIIPITREEETVETASASTKSAFWKYAAVGVVAIGLGGLLTANWYSNEVKSHNMAAQEQAEKQIENKIQQATFSIDDPLPSITFKVTAKRGKFHIVAGAFRSEENAETRLKELKDQNYHPISLGINKYGLHQVIYDSYENREEALKELRKIRLEENPNAWLLVKEL